MCRKGRWKGTSTRLMSRDYLISYAFYLDVFSFQQSHIPPGFTRTENNTGQCQCCLQSEYNRLYCSFKFFNPLPAIPVNTPKENGHIFFLNYHDVKL